MIAPYNTKHYIFIGEINDFNPFMKPFYHFSPKILRAMTRCNKVLEGFIHISTKRTWCRSWCKSNFEQKSICYRSGEDIVKTVGSHLKSFTILCEILTIERQQMAKMSDRVPNERLGTSRFSSVCFSKSTSITPPQNFRNKKLGLI